jgi:rhodanese-related sulfurtransferase
VFDGRRLPEITPADLSDDVLLIDVRDDEEWTAGHAPAARHLPMMEIPGRLDELPRDRNVVVVCRVGARSAQVVAYLLAQGYDRVANLEGGMVAWVSAGLPIVNDGPQAPFVL